MERGEVQRHIIAQVLQHPIAQLLKFGVAVVQRWNDEIGDLKPHAGFMPQPLQRVQYRLQVGQRDLAVKLLGERFEVNIGGVNVAIDVEKRLARDVTIRDHHRVQAGAVGFARDVDNVLAPDGRLVVGERDVGRAVLQRHFDHVFRTERQGVDLVGLGLGDVPVLAKGTTHIAAGGTHGKDLRAREKMVERLLLDRIHRHGGWPPVAELQQASAFILADEAEAALAFSDVAMPRTKVTVETAVGHCLPPARLVNLGLHDC